MAEPVPSVTVLHRTDTKEACIECAGNAGYVQLELEVVAENKAAFALYENVGFEEYGRNPKGFRSRFTGWQVVVLMRLDMER